MSHPMGPCREVAPRHPRELRWVIPAKAGIYFAAWVPAFAATTNRVIPAAPGVTERER